MPSSILDWVSPTCLHTEDWTKYQMATVLLYTCQWQTLLIDHSCWSRQESTHQNAQEPFFSTWRLLVQENWNLFLIPGIHDPFQPKVFSDGGWNKNTFTKASTLRDKRNHSLIPKQPPQPRIWRGCVFARMVVRSGWWWHRAKLRRYK